MEITDNQIKLVLDQDVIDEYREYYFKKYPRRKKFPIDRPIHPSINKWMILKRFSMNKLKQDWKDFIVWWINKLGLNGQQLSEFYMHFISYMPSRRRSDPDNIVPKFILDGMVDAHFIIDDDGKHLDILSLSTDYDKEHPRTEIIITIL